MVYYYFSILFLPSLFYFSVKILRQLDRDRMVVNTAQIYYFGLKNGKIVFIQLLLLWVFVLLSL